MYVRVLGVGIRCHRFCFVLPISIGVSMRKRMDHPMIFRGRLRFCAFSLVYIDLLTMKLCLSIDLCQWQLLVYDCIIDHILDNILSLAIIFPFRFV